MSRTRSGLVAAGVLLWAAIASNVSLADEPPAFPRKKVLILPVRDLRLNPDALFSGDPVSAEDSLRSSLDDALIRTVRAEPELDAVLAVEALASSQQGAANVARGFVHLGVELYRNLRIEDAVQTLEKGAEAARGAFLDLVDPSNAMTLYLYLGLSYLEQERPAMAHVAFKNMFAIGPAALAKRQEFHPGYLPPAAQDAIRAAAVDFLESAAGDVPFGSLERTAALLKAAGVRTLVEVQIVQRTARSAGMSVRVIESGPAATGVRVSWSRLHPIRDDRSAVDLLSRDLSAWVACTDLPSREPPRNLLPRFYLDTAGAYSLFLRHEPTRNLFHTAGFGAGLSYQILSEMDFFVRLNLLTSFPDRYNDLVSGFTSIRLHTGVGYTLRGAWGRFFVHTGLDLQYLTDFLSSTDPACKVDAWRENPAFCDPSHVERLPYRLLGGAGVMLGVDVILFGPIYATFKVGGSTYFFPAGPRSPLNFPVVGEAGLGYAFH